MKNSISKLMALALLAVIVGCGPKAAEHAEGDGHDHAKEEGGGHDDHGEEAGGAKFAEGKGIALMEETKKAIGLETVEAEERKLTPVVSIEAQVYRAANEPSRVNGERAGSAYAAALLSPALAEKLKPGDTATLKTHETEYPATVWKIDPASKDAVNNEEVIIEIPDSQNTLHVGDFVSGSVTQSGGTESVVAVPRSAVLETATGKFAYVQNGDHLLRTPVSTGAENADFIEITDGLYSGDVVASKPVETLYLIELRATKGGGHSH
jgi:Membrane-fusion protein